MTGQSSLKQELKEPLGAFPLAYSHIGPGTTAAQIGRAGAPS
jgi:hypothetical protein